MSRSARSWLVLFATFALARSVAPAAGSLPAPGAAAARLTVGGTSVALTHALAFNAGAYIFLLITDQALPPDQVKSEFQLGLYVFQHHVVGLQLTLDPARKLKEAAYLWEGAKKPCAGCLEVTVSGPADGPLTGTLKSTSKALATETPQVEGAFNAPFSRPSAGKP